MNNELEQQAIETFAAVPEIYQQAFRDAGADFPDKLVEEIKKDPNQAVNLVNSDKNLKSAVISIFKSNKEAILNAVQQMSSMFKDGGKFDYLNKLQQGGQLTRKQAFDEAQKNRGFNRSQVRTAYRNARNAGLDKQAALAAIIGQPQEIEAVERPTLIDKIAAPIDRLTTQSETISTRPTTNYDNVDFGVFSFNDAFGRAREYGLNEFTWNGKRYTTNLAIPALGPDGKNYSIADTLLQNGNISAPDWWISKQWEPATVLSGNGVNPWPAIHAREINPPLKREGGKLSKENEVNKKYIKDSEKAGAKASKEMSDLKAKHEAELKRIRKGQEGLKTYVKRKYNEAAGPIHRGWNNFKQSAPGQVMGALLPVQTNMISTDETGNQMYAASPMFGGPGKSGRMLDADIDKLYINMDNSLKGLFKDLEKVIPGEASKYRIPKGNVYNFSTPDYSKILEGAVFTKPTLKGRILNFVDKLKKK